MRETQVWYPPAPVQVSPGESSIFLAGTIDNGSSLDWQAHVIELLRGEVDHIINPRRREWDASWKQSEDNPQFNEQVTWELDNLQRATWVLMYFSPGSLSPISFLELGLVAAAHPHRLIVCCPEGFWRKGNVDIVCTRYGLLRIEALEDLPALLRELPQPKRSTP